MGAVLMSVAQATPDWLTAVLRACGVLSHGRVVGVANRSSGAWNSDAYHLDLRYSAAAPVEAPRRLFLKINKPEQFDPAEVEFYRFVEDARADLPMLVRCYDTGLAPDARASHLLLADLSTTHFTPVTKAQVLTGATMPAPEHLEQMVDAVAGFHAYWWDHPQLGKGFGQIRGWFGGAEAYQRHTERRTREWALFLAQAGHLISPELCRLYAQVLAGFPALWDRYLAGRFGSMQAVTLSEGDCYFIQFLCPRRREAGTTYLIDFDSVSANLPAYDLVYMFATFWTREQRQEGGRETHLLRRYHAALLARGIRGYSWDDLWRDYRLCVLYMIFDPVWDQTSGAAEAYWLPKLRCLTAAFQDLDCFSLIPA